MSFTFDWWQLGWAFSGFLLVMFFAHAFATRKVREKALLQGHGEGWHDRQHWETDAVVKGKLERP
jgi:hypothetical protein